MSLKKMDVRLNIHPGEYYFGQKFENLFTVLGTCVSLTAWHPVLKLGGMCHFVLPMMPNPHSRNSLGAHELSRYGPIALAEMKYNMAQYAPLESYEIGIFGGSDTLGSYQIGKQNIIVANQWLGSLNLTPVHSDVGGNSSRSLFLSLSSGSIKVKHGLMQHKK